MIGEEVHAPTAVLRGEPVREFLDEAGHRCVVARSIGVLGDKRTQVVYDLDLYGVDPAVSAAVDGVLAAESFIAFSPQTLGEARNRGYRPHRSIRVPAPVDDLRHVSRKQ